MKQYHGTYACFFLFHVSDDRALCKPGCASLVVIHWYSWRFWWWLVMFVFIDLKWPRVFRCSTPSCVLCCWCCCGSVVVVLVVVMVAAVVTVMMVRVVVQFQWSSPDRYGYFNFCQTTKNHKLHSFFCLFHIFTMVRNGGAWYDYVMTSVAHLNKFLNHMLLKNVQWFECIP